MILCTEDLNSRGNREGGWCRWSDEVRFEKCIKKKGCAKSRRSVWSKTFWSVCRSRRVDSSRTHIKEERENGSNMWCVESENPCVCFAKSREMNKKKEHHRFQIR